MRLRCPRPAPATRLAFAGFRFRSDVIVLAVCWYLRFGLSYRDVAELLTKRGVEVDHVTVYRWGAAMFGSKLQDDRARSPCSQTGTDRDQRQPRLGSQPGGRPHGQPTQLGGIPIDLHQQHKREQQRQHQQKHEDG